jgi:multiple sugar transport system substrate-binding protein
VTNKIILKGITWDHSRGYTPLVAAAQRFGELHPTVEIHWKKRSLQEFADHPLEALAEQYDLLVIDHPWVGRAATCGSVLPLDKYLPRMYFDDLLDNSVGFSHQSYHYDNHQWALAIDAATPVASYRADLFQKNNIPKPTTWNELIDLAQKGKVAVPGIPIDLLMNFYMFCIAAGSQPFLHEDEVTDTATGLKALDAMKTLWSLTNPKLFNCNPIAIAELMTTTDEYWYCPFAYGYSNYARKGYAKHTLNYMDLIQHGASGPLKSTIGGTGLAVSSVTPYRELAIKFTIWVASAEIQATLYVEHGGQPAHRSAWISERVNSNYNNYFINTLPALKRAYMRPRYNGYLYFQDQAGLPLQQYLQNGGNPEIVLQKMNTLYRESKTAEKNI